MKKHYILIFIYIIGNIVNAQTAGLGFSYQAVIRNSQGTLLKNTTVDLQFKLLPGSSSTSPSWQETHTVTTDTFGICTVIIGEGSRTGGSESSFAEVDFSSAEYWMDVEIKDKGTFTSIGKQKLLSVPYAKVAGNAQIFPSGMIIAFAGDTSKIPAGWLLCDGRAINRSLYPGLYSVIGINWGRGNNSSTFNLPDLRGRFLRGVDMGVGNDPDRNNRTASNIGGNIGDSVGSVQGDAMQGHKHLNGVITPGNSGSWGMGTYNGSPTIVVTGASQTTGIPSISTSPVNDGTNGSPNTAEETRPDNASVYYIIKI